MPQIYKGFTQPGYARESPQLIMQACVEVSMHTQAIEYRSRYVQQYAQCLQDGKMGGNESIAEMDAELHEHTILTFRKLAHAKASPPCLSVCADLSQSTSDTIRIWLSASPWGLFTGHDCMSHHHSGRAELS